MRSRAHAVERAAARLPLASTGAVAPNLLATAGRAALEAVARALEHSFAREREASYRTRPIPQSRIPPSGARYARQVAAGTDSSLGRRRILPRFQNRPALFILSGPADRMPEGHALANGILETSKLSVHVVAHNPRDLLEWSPHLARRDTVLIANADQVLAAIRASALTLDAFHLIVLYQAEQVLVHGDPLRTFVREMLYLPGNGHEQPRVFALCDTFPAHPTLRGALESELRIHLFHDDRNGDVVCRESFTAINRVPEAPLAEHQFLYYHVEDLSQVVSLPGLSKDERRISQRLNIKNRLDYRSGRMNDQEYLALEVGLLGVALYQRHHYLRRLRRRSRRNSRQAISGACGDPTHVAGADGAVSEVKDMTGRDPEKSEFRIPDHAQSYSEGNVDLSALPGIIANRDMLLGLSSKVLSLLNILNTWCAAASVVENSTSAGPMVIIHAGRPVVAAALSEILAALPGFHGVSVRLVMGDSRSARSFEKDCDQAADTDEGWQGADSDDDAISSFAVGDANILIVASENTRSISRSRRPIPPCRLVVRFDGSTIDPDLDGGGGRCRVITFRPKTMAMPRAFARNGNVQTPAMVLKSSIVIAGGTANNSVGHDCRESKPSSTKRGTDGSDVMDASGPHIPLGEDLSGLSCLQPNRPESSCANAVDEGEIFDDEDNSGHKDNDAPVTSLRPFSGERDGSYRTVRQRILDDRFATDAAEKPWDIERSSIGTASCFGRKRISDSRYGDLNASGGSFTFSIRPASALCGPDEKGEEYCYLYTVDAIVDTSPPQGSSDPSGIGSFVFAFGAELKDRDLMVEPIQIGSDSAFDPSAKFNMRLSYIGSQVITAEQVARGRRYTACLFSTILRSCDVEMFQWGSGALANGDQTRKYLVLPVLRQTLVNPKRSDVDVSLQRREDAFQFYIGHGSVEDDHRSCDQGKNNSSVGCSNFDKDRKSEYGPAEGIDWDAVNCLLEFREAPTGPDAKESNDSGPSANFCRVDAYSHLEGTLTFASFCGRRRAYMSGDLDYSLSPLSNFVRQKRFAVDQDGNLVDHDKALSELLPVLMQKPSTSCRSPSAIPNGAVDQEPSRLHVASVDALALVPDQIKPPLDGQDQKLDGAAMIGNNSDHISPRRDALSASALAACAIDFEDTIESNKDEVGHQVERESNTKKAVFDAERNVSVINPGNVVHMDVAGGVNTVAETVVMKDIPRSDPDILSSIPVRFNDGEDGCSTPLLSCFGSQNDVVVIDVEGLDHAHEPSRAAVNCSSAVDEDSGVDRRSRFENGSKDSVGASGDLADLDRSQVVVSSPARNLDIHSAAVPGDVTGKKGLNDQGMANGMYGESRKRKFQVFDPARNKKRRRTSWYGPVRESYERYFAASKSVRMERLDQPLLPVAQPESIKLGHFYRASRGTPLSTIIREIFELNAESNPEGKLHMIPEKMSVYPLSAAALFLPAVLQRLERHITTCALRDVFTDVVGVEIGIPSLLQAVTSTMVNPNVNYERLELLGDAVLKLTSTLRVFVKYPHKPEGDLHPLRCAIVSNSALQKKGQHAGIHHFLNFSRELLSDWRPPGWDKDAIPLPVHDKALADVVEAIAGAYYLKGAADFAAEDQEGLSSCLAGNRDGFAYSRFLTKVVIHGYKVATKFFEAIDVLDGPEPDFNSILLATIHSFHPPESPVPKNCDASSFPLDQRLSNPKVPWEQHLGLIEESIGYRFKRRQLLFCALTHGSYAEGLDPHGNPILSVWANFQRMEFLGDAAIDFCVARYLFDRYPDLGPGELTDLKSAVVSNEAFARIAVKHGMHKYLYARSVSMKREVDLYVQSLNEEDAVKGESTDSFQWLSEREAPKVLGDLFEAIAGAILVDAGLETVWNVYMKLLEATLRDRADPANFETHPVKVFQDFVMKVHRLSVGPPQYVVPRTMGARRLMRADVYLHKVKVGSGEGTTKKRAMCRAAIQAYQRLTTCQEGSEDARLLHTLRLKGDKERVAMAVAKQRPPPCLPRRR
jgi:dsRNA-specific ribonuclease